MNRNGRILTGRHDCSNDCRTLKSAIKVMAGRRQASVDHDRPRQTMQPSSLTSPFNPCHVRFIVARKGSASLTQDSGASRNVDCLDIFHIAGVGNLS